MQWLKGFFSGLFGIFFQDLPYIINRIFRDIDFETNRARTLHVIDGEADISLKDSLPKAKFVEVEIEEAE
jgi:hypothetical protein